MQFSKVVFEMIKFGVVLLATCAFAGKWSLNTKYLFTYFFLNWLRRQSRLLSIVG